MCVQVCMCMCVCMCEYVHVLLKMTTRVSREFLVSALGCSQIWCRVRPVMFFTAIQWNRENLQSKAGRGTWDWGEEIRCMRAASYAASLRPSVPVCGHSRVPGPFSGVPPAGLEEGHSGRVLCSMMQKGAIPWKPDTSCICHLNPQNGKKKQGRCLVGVPFM